MPRRKIFSWSALTILYRASVINSNDRTTWCSTTIRSTTSRLTLLFSAVDRSLSVSSSRYRSLKLEDVRTMPCTESQTVTTWTQMIRLTSTNSTLWRCSQVVVVWHQDKALVCRLLSRLKKARAFQLCASLRKWQINLSQRVPTTVLMMKITLIESLLMHQLLELLVLMELNHRALRVSLIAPSEVRSQTETQVRCRWRKKSWVGSTRLDSFTFTHSVTYLLT